MGYRYEVNGRMVEFERQPTEDDIDEAAASFAPQSAQEQPAQSQPQQNETLNINDLPHILAKGSSGILGGVPETVMRNPISGVTGAAGKAGMGIARFFNRNVPEPQQEPNFFPEANSTQGEMAGIAADLAGGLVSPVTGGRAIVASGKGIKNFLTKPSSGELLHSARTKRTGMINDAIPSITTKSLPGIRSAVEKWIPTISKQYGERYRPLVENANVTADRLIEAMTNAAKESDLLGLKPEEMSEQGLKFMQWLDGLKAKSADQLVKSPILDKSGNAIESISKGVSEFNVGKMDDFLKQFLAENYGTQYGSGQRILTNARKAFSEILNDVPGLQELKKEFAPKLQAKNAAWRAFRPFSKVGDYERTGVGFLRKAARGEPDQIVNDLMKYLETENPGIFDGVKNVGKQFKATSDQIRTMSAQAVKDRAWNDKLGVAAKIVGYGVPVAGTLAYLLKKK